MLDYASAFYVSIHAPVKERLELIIMVLNSDSVSIHAPVKERLADFVESK